MIKCLKMSLKIDMTYAINSFIYGLRKLPIFKDLFTDDIYKSKALKKIIRILSIILSAGRMILYRFLYFFVIYLISSNVNSKAVGLTFVHIYFVFTIIGMFINNKLLNTSTKKYFSIVLFGMDAKEYMKSSLCWNLVTSFILNGLFLLVFGKVLGLSFTSLLLLLFFSLFVRVIGEAFNLAFYKKFHYIWYNNTKLYFGIVILLLAVSFLPYFSIFISQSLIGVSTVIGFLLAVVSFIYLFTFKHNYQIIYKQLNTVKKAMNQENQKAYSRQAMVEVRNRDIKIADSKLKGKTGYELFNAIFFERHREILSRSAKNYSFVIACIYIGIIFVVGMTNSFDGNVHKFLLNNLGWFVIIMYFINRGAIITQAMFFNCDHAMLTYNFYREPKVLLGLFKKRVKTVVKVNLLPALIIALGNSILLYITGGSSYLTYVTSFIFILLLSVFFSVHYMIIYYLLQPYNKDMELKKASYSIVTFITYIVSYQISKLVVSSLIFSILGVLFTISYIVLSLILVYKKAPQTFKIN